MNAARWSPTMKRVIVGVLLVAVLFLVYRAGDIVRPFLWAAILAYILLPIVRALEKRFTISHAWENTGPQADAFLDTCFLSQARPVV